MKNSNNNSEVNAPTDWLIGGGDMGELIRSIAWSATPLGPRDEWPYPLRAITNVALSSTFPMAILWGKELIFIYNDAYSVIAADRHPNAMGRSTREIWPEVWDFNKPIFKKVMQEGRAVHLEDQLFRIKRQGEMVDAYFTLSYSPIWLEHDCVGGTLVTLFETTGRKQAVNKLRNSITKLEAAIANSTDAIFISDVTGNFIHYNDAFVSYHRFKNKEECSRMISECYDYLEAYFSDGTLAPTDMWAIPRALRGEQVSYTEYLLRNKISGEKWWGRYSFGPFHDEEGKIAGCVVVCRDITDRKQEELALKESEEKYRTLFETMTQGVVIQDAQGKILEANTSACEILGLSLDQMFGKTAYDPRWKLIHEDGSPYDPYEMPSNIVLRTGKAVKGVFCGIYVPEKNEYRWIMIDSAPQFKEDETELFVTLTVFTDITKRKHAEMALLESEIRYRAIVEDQTELICRSSLDGTIIFVNQAYCHYFGKKDNEIIGTNFMPFIVEEDRAKVQKQIASLAQENPIVLYEERVILPNGEIRHQQWINRLILNEQGNPLEIQGVGRDITERKEIERLLRESEKKYKELLQIAKSAILRWNVDGTLTFFNKYAQTLFGYHEDEVIGKSVNILVPESESTGKDLRTLVKDIARNPELYIKNINENVCSDGRRLWMAWTNTPIFDEKGIISEILAVGMNITELKLTQDELAESVEKHRNLFEAIADAVLFIDKETGRIMDANTTAFHLFGYGKNELLSLNLTDLSAEPEKTLESLKRGDTYIPQRLYRKKDGTIFPIEIVAREFTWKEDRVRIVSARDITSRIEAEEEKRKLEESLHQAQKLESVGRLAGGVAHDFNNMLGVILGYGEILLKELHPDDPIREDISQIVDAGHRSASLTRQLLAFSRKQKLRPEILDLNIVIKNLEKMLRRIIGEDIKLQLKLSEGLDMISADPGQIEQVIMNLAVNARDAMPLGGNLMIETTNALLDEFYSEDHVGVKPGKYVQMTISDTGIGIEKSVLPYIFDPFFTTKEKEKGTGLGLSTVYGIVKQSGGNIWCYSEPNQGTTFKIYLPQVDFKSEIKSDDSKWNSSQEKMGNRELILVVEDDTHLRKLCEKMLSRYGYKVITASNAGEVLLLIEEEGIHPDLVITDVVMPGMSGKVLGDRLKKSRPGLKILFMSGYTDDAIVYHGVLDSESFFIEKPFSSESLAKKVHDILSNKLPK